MSRFIRAFMILALISVGRTAPAGPEASDFQSAWPAGVERIWAGPEYWANRLQDWRIKNGRLECLLPASDRNVHLLTRALLPRNGELTMSVRAAVTAVPRGSKDRNWIGFRVGAQAEFEDYRYAALYGKGLNVGISIDGDLFIGDYEVLQREPVRKAVRDRLAGGLDLVMSIRPVENRCAVAFEAHDTTSGEIVSRVEQGDLDPATLAGNLALVSHLPDLEIPESGSAAWFSGWQIAGAKAEVHDERAFGPILFCQYTLSRDVLKMTAQLPPVGAADGSAVRLRLRKASGDWMEAAEAPLDPDARTATFRIPGWDSDRDVPYQLVYEWAAAGPGRTSAVYEGKVRREPKDKNKLVVAAFTCQNDFGFPHAEVALHAGAHDPDLLFFSGDQIYERVAGYGTQYQPVDKAILDYLRKWYLFGWAFGGLLRDHPTVTIPDDHDVYHGNLWGAGGKATAPGVGLEAQDSGGYKMPARWVNMVQRTQTSHLPDPADPAPAEQGIGVYFCELKYAGLSIAVLEDRKFKSAPAPLLPQAEVRNGWARNPDFKPDKDADAKGAELLGERQLGFLKNWAADWSGGTWMKTVFSQTLWADLFTLPAGTRSDDGVPQLPLFKPDEYPPDDVPAADMDSDGWPPSGRNAALREIRKAFALHICGDQHLPSTIQYGVEAFGDSGYAVCVPAISNLWPRRWFPQKPGARLKPGAPRYTGDYKDAFGNRMSVAAVADPLVTGRQPALLYDRATGYAIVRFDKKSRDISIECWSRYADPNSLDGKPYPGWPVIISQFDNYGRAAKAYLPTLKFKGMADPVVQVIDEKNGEIVYTVRAKGDSFRPKVFAAGAYMIKVGEPGTERWQTLRRMNSLPPGGQGQKVVEFK
jgi:alkaline phosphatase D